MFADRRFGLYRKKSCQGSVSVKLRGVWKVLLQRGNRGHAPSVGKQGDERDFSGSGVYVR